LARPVAPKSGTSPRSWVERIALHVVVAHDPKAVRVFDGGHMGDGPVVPTIGAWLDEHLLPRLPS
jgi:hypothetical protein